MLRNYDFNINLRFNYGFTKAARDLYFQLGDAFKIVFFFFCNASSDNETHKCKQWSGNNINRIMYMLYKHKNRHTES